MKPENFDEYFKCLHGYSPFLWQSRLAREVCSNGVWPQALDLPTSAGKTAALDIALFHLAHEADKPVAEHRARRRISFIVDRRLVVDEAYLRAERIKQRLEAALSSNAGILTEVARRLVRIAGANDKPLQVVRLRGGMPRERAFIRNPLQPAVILSTVDQIGSRLLFRGYGVSEFMRPIHAALTGADNLIILDEAHLSRPFMQTIEWVRRYQSPKWAQIPINQPCTIVQMSATPADGIQAFSLLDREWQDPGLAPRLRSAKIARLTEITTEKEDGKKSQQQLVDKLVDEARDLMAAQRERVSTPVVGVVANRVALARGVFERLRHNDETDAVLLTGRIRPHDRDLLLDRYLQRMKAGRTEADNSRPLFVVATQTIEVGADLDFDGLVTEAAPLDALRQRFGRLNRLGKRTACAAVIVFDKAAAKDDPIYGEALGKAWKWINGQAKKPRGQKHKVLDFGVQALKRILPQGDELSELLSPTTWAPALMPAHVDMLAQTSPAPAVEPDIPLYLHGVDSQSEDVQLVWRADLPEIIDAQHEDQIVATVAALPPSSREAISIPVWAARALLLGRGAIEVTDVEGGRASEDAFAGKAKYALRWRGVERSSIVTTKEVRPGDLLVLPCSYGGLDEYGWNPKSRKAVEDIADQALRVQRGKIFLRLHSVLVPNWFDPDQEESLFQARRSVNDALDRVRQDDELSSICDDLIAYLLALGGMKKHVREALEVLSSKRREILYPTAALEGLLLTEKGNSAREFTDDDDSSSLTRKGIELESHCNGVGQLAAHFGEGCGLAAELVADLKLAGTLHDLGKADPRFQAWLHGGDRFAAKGEKTLLAKSGMNASDRVAIRLARERARYPAGARHECYSVAIARQNKGLLVNSAHDSELVLYLIGTHHGRGRPFMPVIADGGTRMRFSFRGESLAFEGTHYLERLDSDLTDLFWRLNRRYGYWGLAYLETLVRLADHHQSEHEMKDE